MRNDKGLSDDENAIDSNDYCPFCEQTTTIETHHSLESDEDEQRMDVVCSECGEQFTHVYKFSHWTLDNVTIEAPMNKCPHCSEEVTEDMIEDTWFDDAGMLEGSLDCPQCNKIAKAHYKLRRWEE